MKALSVRQPWALEINDGIKNLEFRTWNTHHRGPLLISASSHDSGLWLDIEMDDGRAAAAAHRLPDVRGQPGECQTHDPR